MADQTKGKDFEPIKDKPTAKKTRAPKAEVKRAEQPAKVVRESKVKDVTVDRRKPQVVQSRRRNLFEVKINGRDRLITSKTYAALKNDPRYNIELPAGSPLMPIPAAKVPDSDCKDC